MQVHSLSLDFASLQVSLEAEAMALLVMQASNTASPETWLHREYLDRNLLAASRHLSLVAGSMNGSQKRSSMGSAFPVCVQASRPPSGRALQGSMKGFCSTCATPCL